MLGESFLLDNAVASLHAFYAYTAPQLKGTLPILMADPYPLPSLQSCKLSIC